MLIQSLLITDSAYCCKLP